LVPEEMKKNIVELLKGKTKTREKYFKRCQSDEQMQN
jgi:hypothetical protein